MNAEAWWHWAFRGAVAACAGAIGNFVIALAYVWVSALWQDLNLPLLIAALVIAAMVPLIVYGILTYHYGPPAWHGESRCRKCRHILRGLSEPRCPECGEAI